MRQTWIIGSLFIGSVLLAGAVGPGCGSYSHKEEFSKQQQALSCIPGGSNTCTFERTGQLCTYNNLVFVCESCIWWNQEDLAQGSSIPQNLNCKPSDAGAGGAAQGGSAGQAGTAGAAGTAGESGTAGSAGSTGGAAGTAGEAGAAGTSQGGAAGSGGAVQGGSAGSAGSSCACDPGAAFTCEYNGNPLGGIQYCLTDCQNLSPCFPVGGMGGGGGAAGAAGAAGTSTGGAGGAAGTAGNAGSSGTGGASGEAGAAGSAGTAGTAGNAGEAGAAGTSTGGAAGSAGAAGAAGSGTCTETLGQACTTELAYACNGTLRCDCALRWRASTDPIVNFVCDNCNGGGLCSKANKVEGQLCMSYLPVDPDAGGVQQIIDYVCKCGWMLVVEDAVNLVCEDAGTGGSSQGGAGGSSQGGSAGQAGSAGAAGTSTGGAGGTAGSAGSAGQAGTAGTAGSAGTGGAGGTAGSAGQAGSAGSAGTGGTAQGGSAGSAGTAGTAGAAGTSTGGAGGAAGSAGSAGQGGTAQGGAGGSAGSAGTSGAGGGGGSTSYVLKNPTILSDTCQNSQIATSAMTLPVVGWWLQVDDMSSSYNFPGALFGEYDWTSSQVSGGSTVWGLRTVANNPSTHSFFMNILTVNTPYSRYLTLKYVDPASLTACALYHEDGYICNSTADAAQANNLFCPAKLTLWHDGAQVATYTDAAGTFPPASSPIKKWISLDKGAWNVKLGVQM